MRLSVPLTPSLSDFILAQLLRDFGGEFDGSDTWQESNLCGYWKGITCDYNGNGTVIAM